MSSEDKRQGRGVAQDLCASERLSERGLALVFDVLWQGQPVRAFALRMGGRVVAYLNRCAHMPAEMDWNPGQFLDSQGQWIICSIHGALYDPGSGECVAGPCTGRRLVRLETIERDGRIAWYPSEHAKPMSLE